MNLDVIKAKNKPKAPPKKPKAAPFFLPTIPGLSTQFDLSAVEKAAAEEDSLKSTGAISFTKFGAALSQVESQTSKGRVITCHASHIRLKLKQTWDQCWRVYWSLAQARSTWRFAVSLQRVGEALG